MNDKWLRTLITVLALLAVVAHIVWPALRIDAITVTLLVVAVIPWLRPLFKSLELPGGLKVEFQDLKNVTKRADAAGLVAPEPPADPNTYSFQLIADTDPNLALAGLRIELERRLRQLAESHGMKTDAVSMGKLLRDLNQRELINGVERSVLADLAGLLNSAVHGAEVDRQAAAWALEVGPRILRALDDRVTHAPDVQYAGIAEYR
jgi:hypothetical protein